MSKVSECVRTLGNVEGEQSSSEREISSDGKGLVRKTIDKVRVPVQQRVHRRVKQSRQAVDRLVHKAGNFINLMVNIAVASLLVMTSSMFLYATFYYSYMPLDTHETKLNFQFLSCGNSTGLCSFPNATANISPRKRNLMPGQRYSFSLLLEMPDSPVNQDLGMFMTCLSLEDNNGRQLNNICRSSIFEYRSELLRVIETFVLFPFLLIGSATQRQWVTVHYHNEFVDNTHTPAITATISLQSKFIQVYSGQLRIAANLYGLRGVMYHHPWMSAVMGVTLNITVMALLIMVSWARLNDAGEASVDVMDVMVKDNIEASEKVKDNIEDSEDNEEVTNCYGGEKQYNLDDEKA